MRRRFSTVRFHPNRNQPKRTKPSTICRGFFVYICMMKRKRKSRIDKIQEDIDMIKLAIIQLATHTGIKDLSIDMINVEDSEFEEPETKRVGFKYKGRK